MPNLRWVDCRQIPCLYCTMDLDSRKQMELISSLTDNTNCSKMVVGQFNDTGTNFISPSKTKVDDRPYVTFCSYVKVYDRSSLTFCPYGKMNDRSRGHFVRTKR
ncbi:Hypothetical predicted protein [Mytilus galloprovincialis]|uniref:Uncharacterized protein n=1 Tax=Mytilus galloprovincialis TaxID=29158 RepID=A0A8B6E684_MYTGA|nr:Hypothetical predicted protein [Mytilus galloprovincialis]